jgi:hypothetical protein
VRIGREDATGSVPARPVPSRAAPSRAAASRSAPTRAVPSSAAPARSAPAGGRVLPAGGLALLDVRTEHRWSVPWGERVTLGRGPGTHPRHVPVPDDRVSRLTAEIEVRDDAYLIINRQRHGGLLTLFVPGVPGKDRIRTGNGLLVRDDRSSLGLWFPDGQELTLALLRFAPTAAAGVTTSGGLAGGRTIDTSLPTAETWWSVLVAACGPTLIAAATAGAGTSREVHGDADQIAEWHRAEGRPAPSPKTQSEACRHAQRWLRGLRLNDKTRGWRIAVVEQVIHLRLVTLDDVRLLFPSQVPPAVR